jgi:protein disulfide-isomerase
MKQALSLFVFVLMLTSIVACAQNPSPSKTELTWYTKLDEAQKISKAQKKPIFAFFTGSDWCGWCHKLHRDVLDKPAFIDWAKKNVVLLELDYPRRKQLPADLAQQNGELQQVFKVQGYPTVWLFTMEEDAATKKKNINPLGSLGYPQGAEAGKEEVKFLKDANAFLAQKAK